MTESSSSPLGNTVNSSHNNNTDWEISSALQPSLTIPDAERVLTATIKQQQEASSSTPHTSFRVVRRNSIHQNKKKEQQQQAQTAHNYRMVGYSNTAADHDGDEYGMNNSSHSAALLLIGDNSNLIEQDNEKYWKNQRRLGIMIRHAFFPPRHFQLHTKLIRSLSISGTKFAKNSRLNALRLSARKCFLALFFLCSAFRLTRREGTLRIRVCDSHFVDDTHHIHLPTGARCVALPQVLSNQFEILALNRLRVVFQPILMRRVLRKSLSNIYQQHYREVATPNVEDLKLSSTFFSLFPNASLQELMVRGKMRTYTKKMWVGAPRSARSAARSVVNRSSDSKLGKLLPSLSSSGVLPAITPSLYSAFIVLHGVVTDLDNKECSIGQCYGETCALAEGGVSGNGFIVASGMALTWEIDVNEIVSAISNLMLMQQLNSTSTFSSAAARRKSLAMTSVKSDDEEDEYNNNQSFGNSMMMHNNNNARSRSKSGSMMMQRHSSAQQQHTFFEDEDDTSNHNNNINNTHQNNNRNPSFGISNASFASKASSPNNKDTTTHNHNHAATSPQKCFELIMNHIIDLRIQIISQYFRPTIDQIQSWELFRAASPVDVTTHILPRLVPKVFFANTTIVSPESSESDRAVYLVARGRVTASESSNHQQTQSQDDGSNNKNNKNNNNTIGQQQQKEWKSFGEYEGYFSEAFDLSYVASTIVDCWVLPRGVIQSIAKIPYLRPDMILRGLRLREQMLHRSGPNKQVIEYVLSHYLGKRLHPRLVETVLKTLQPKVYPAGERVITAGEDEKTCIFFIRGKLNQSSANGFIPHAPPALYGPQLLHSMFDPASCAGMTNAAVVSSWKLSLVAVRNVECWMVTVSRLHAALKIFFETCDIANHLLVGKLTTNLPTSVASFASFSSGNSGGLVGGSHGMFSTMMSGHSNSNSTMASPTRGEKNNNGNSSAIASPYRSRKIVGISDGLAQSRGSSAARNFSPLISRRSTRQMSSSQSSPASATPRGVPNYLRATQATSMRFKKEDDDQQQDENTNNEDMNIHHQHHQNQTHHRPQRPNTTSGSFTSGRRLQKQSSVTFDQSSIGGASMSINNNSNNNLLSAQSSGSVFAAETTFGSNFKRPSEFHDYDHKIEMQPFNLKTDTIGQERLKAVREQIEQEYKSQIHDPVINEWLEIPLDDDDPRTRLKARRMSDLECLKVLPQPPPDKRFLLRMRKLPQTPRLHGKNLPEFGDVARKKKAEEALRLKEIAANEKLNFGWKNSGGGGANNAAGGNSSSSGGGNHQTHEHDDDDENSGGNLLTEKNDHHSGTNNTSSNNNESSSAAAAFRRRKSQVENIIKRRAEAAIQHQKTSGEGGVTTVSPPGSGQGTATSSQQQQPSPLSPNQQTQAQQQQQQGSSSVASPAAAFSYHSQGEPPTMSELLGDELSKMLKKHKDKLETVDSARKFQMKLLRKAEERAEKMIREPEYDRL